MNKKEPTIIMWNHLQYIDQAKAMDKIAELLEEQSDETTRIALAAALAELEMWSNASCETVNELVYGDEEESQFDNDGNPITKTYIH